MEARENRTAADPLPKQYENLVEAIGLEATRRLCTIFGGDYIYIPKPDRLENMDRDKQIRAQYNGRNLRNLAKHYRLTANQIRNITKGVVIRPPKEQISMMELLEMKKRETSGQ